MSTPAEKVIDTPPADPVPASNEPNWPDTWRELYAGKDEQKLSQLSRYTSPTAAFDALLAAKQRIRSGELKSPFPETGTDEEKTRWRLDNGLPETPDKYDLTFEDGLVIGDEDKPVIDDFLKAAHESNMAPNQVKGAVKWYYNLLQKQEEQAAQLDAQAKQQTEDALRAEWGNDYRGNVNRITALFDMASPEIKESFLNGRLSDGTPIGSSVEAMKFLADIATQLNPVTTLIPGAGANVSGALEDEIKKIEDVMKNDRKKYNNDESMQSRLRQLYAAREKTKQR